MHLIFFVSEFLKILLNYEHICLSIKGFPVQYLFSFSQNQTCFLDYALFDLVTY